ncbi:uncharacterized protein LOC119099317 isoform X2 [Pollicipes pollicipes]|uniref:uncharacterized protein LOC119099317 isoform X2 n=1 Tax=Pollicipes pollicipes TaxID=41117 RepID=UPI00188524C5|nr:uncharacterized protein LOC119099317 isoform X2 [Pollicipes pollicipes]
MTMYDGGSALYSVSPGGGGCCSGLCRVALMFITVLSMTFTIGTLIIAGSALYNIYNEPALYAVDRQGLIQLWILVAGGAIGVFTNICGFTGALLRVRCLLLGYALVTGLAVGAHLVVVYMQRSAGDRRHIGRLNITDDPHSVWTVEMNAYAAEVLKRVRTVPNNSTVATNNINNTINNLRVKLAPDAKSVKQTALSTVNTIQSFLKCCGKSSVEDYIQENVTIPESCCKSSAACNATLRQEPRLNLKVVREMSHPQGCGPFLHAAHAFVVTVITWVSYVVAGSQLCGAVIAMTLALFCMK